MKGKNDRSLDTPLARLEKSVEETGVSVEREAHRFTAYNVDVSFPFVVVTLCLSGSARALYDMQEMSQQQNDIGVILPGHIMRPLDCSDDYTYARVAISQKMLEELKSQLFSQDYKKYDHAPVFSLTDVQARRMMSIIENLSFIASHSEIDLQHRNHILTAQMVVGYELLNYYRKNLDSQYQTDNNRRIFSRFCELVAEHYRESKEILFYASQLNLHPKYLSRVVREVTHGITPKEWLERYVVMQAKRLMVIHPNQSMKYIAFLLGFTEAASFYRFFKRVAGQTPREYSENL